MYENQRITRITKILSLLAFVFLSLIIVIVRRTPSADGYELSIYSAYPVYFWLFFIGSFACGTAILLLHSFNVSENKYWIFGILIILFTNIIFLLLPECRGYFFYGREDTATHLGYIKDIISTGSIGDMNFYPIVHLLSLGIIRIAGISLANVPSLSFIIFYILYITGIYLLSQSLVRHFRYTLILFAIAAPFMFSFFHVNMHPNIFALFAIPYILYIYYSKQKFSLLQNISLSFIMVIFITLSHPTTSLFLLVIFSMLLISRIYYHRFIAGSRLEISSYVNMAKYPASVALLIGSIFAISFVFLPAFHRLADIAVNKILSDSTSFQLHTEAVKSGFSYGLTVLQAAGVFINRYGSILLLLIFSLFASFYVLLKTVMKNYRPRPVTFVFGFIFMGVTSLSLTMFFGGFVEKNLVRIARVPILIGIIITSITIYYLINCKVGKGTILQLKSYKKIILTLGIVIVVIGSLSYGSIYNSPRVYKPNLQVTKADITAPQWLEQSRDEGVSINTRLPLSYNRFRQYNFGVSSSSAHGQSISITQFPPHFGYNETDKTFKQSLFSQPTYIVLFQRDKINHLLFPKNVRESVDQWNTEDINTLNHEFKVAKIYTNGESEVWKVCV